MPDYPKTQWHHLLGRMLELWLRPVDIQVHTDLPVLATPPRADVLLLRRQGKAWTQAQQAHLADGLRHTDAGHLLLEFKRSEGLTEGAWRQIMAYDHFYADSQSLQRRELASFLISASTPRHRLLAELGYEPSCYPGVYYSQQRLCKPVTVILLNELRNEGHNAPLKCFATRKGEQTAALKTLTTNPAVSESLELEQLTVGLWRLVMKHPPEIDALTPEYVEQVGKEFLDALIKAAPPGRVLGQYAPRQRLTDLTPEQIREALEPLPPEQRLAGLDPETIRRYLERLERQGKKH